MVNNRSWPYFDQAAGESGVLAQWNTNTMTQAQLFFDTLVADSDCPDVDCLVGLSSTALAAAAMQTVNDDDGTASSKSFWGTILGPFASTAPYPPARAV